MPSTEIDENEEALAVLEINPISKGHTIVIPKEHITKPEDIPPKAKELATQIGKKLKRISNAHTLLLKPTLYRILFQKSMAPK